MRKYFKSILLAVLTFIMIVSIFPVTAAAESDSFEPRLSSPGKNNPYYNRRLNVYSQTGYGMPNCTAYAYGRIYEITGEAPRLKSGNAGSWWFKNKRNHYYDYGKEPKIGAIACWSGHVAVVEKVEGNKVTISQSHWGKKYFDTATYSNPKAIFTRQSFYGYIYASDSVLEAEEEEEPVVYSYTAEKSEFEDIAVNPFSKIIYSEKDEPILVMNSHMVTNAVK